MSFALCLNDKIDLLSRANITSPSSSIETSEKVAQLVFAKISETSLTSFSRETPAWMSMLMSKILFGI